MDTTDKSELKVIAFLLLLTIALVLLQKYSLNRSLIIDGNSIYAVTPTDDRASGGNSVAEFFRDENGFVLDCEIKAGYAWPYCEFDISLLTTTANGAETGIDISKYDRVGLWASYDEHDDSGIRFHLRNFNERYSTPGKSETLKYNSIEFFGHNSDYPLWVSLDSFQVSTWWLVENKIALTHMAPEFTNIHYLELITGTDAAPGKYRLIVERIEFHGKVLNEKNLYLLLLAVWILAAIVYVIRWIVEYRKEFIKSKFRQNELEAINRLLNIRSRQLEEKISRDPLTGVLNREGLQKLFYEGLARADKINGLCIMFMDIDHFKTINDTYGHNIGDSVLQHFTHLISKNTRNSDVLARWGGEEFILACPDSNLEDTKVLAEKLRHTIEQSVWPNNVKLTCSFGIAQMSNETTDAFIHRADCALYEAKSQGRNRVVASEAPK